MIISIITKLKLAETYANLIDENSPARNFISKHSGFSSIPTGKIQPMSMSIQPKYIISSAKIEKIMVAMGASIEIPPKLNTETKIVALIANTDARKDKVR